MKNENETKGLTAIKSIIKASLRSKNAMTPQYSRNGSNPASIKAEQRLGQAECVGDEILLLNDILYLVDGLKAGYELIENTFDMSESIKSELNGRKSVISAIEQVIQNWEEDVKGNQSLRYPKK